MINKLDFGEVTKAFLEGDRNDVKSLISSSSIDSLRVKYSSVDMSTGESSPEYRTIKLKDVTVGIQNKSDNIDNKDQSSSALVTLSEVESIAYPLVTEINKLIDIINAQEAAIDSLDSRVTILEGLIPPIPII